MHQFNLISSSGNQPITLHENILDILFKHKKEISLRLSNIRGLFYTDHVSINILTPENKILIFSITPSVEYNLTIHELLKYDKSFFPNFYKDYSLFWWDQAYHHKYANELKKIKEEMHGFTLGLGLARRMKNIHLIYSYATRSQADDLKLYYEDHKNELFHMGDYAYKLISDFYSIYCPPKKANLHLTREHNPKDKNYLRLIVDNTE